MAESNEFSVEVQQAGGCWQPACVINYLEKESIVCAYLRESPVKEISLSLENVRWPRETAQAMRTVLNEKVQVEYCEKHDNYIHNGIYSWITGEVVEVHTENCLINTVEKQILVENNRLFAHIPKRNFRDDNVRIYGSYIEVVGELKSRTLDLENLKSIGKEVHALTIRYIEKEGKLHAISTDSYTSELCDSFQKKQCKLTAREKDIPIEDKPHSGAKLHTQVLKIDSRLTGLAMGYKHSNINKARFIDGIKSVNFRDDSFTIIGTSTEAVETVVQMLDVISVVEEIPLCNKHKIITVIEEVKKWRLQQVEQLETDTSSNIIKVNLVGRRVQVDDAIIFLQDTKMSKRVGERNVPSNPNCFQTPDCTPHFHNRRRPFNRPFSESSHSYSKSNSLTSHDSEPEYESSPVTSPPETFPPSPKIPAVKPHNNNNNTKSEQLKTDPVPPLPETLHSVPYSAKLKLPDNVRTDSPVLEQPSKPPMLLKQKSEPNGYINKCSTPPTHSNKYYSNTRGQTRPKARGSTNPHNPRLTNYIEFHSSSRDGAYEHSNKEPGRYTRGRGNQGTRGHAPRKYSQQRKKNPSDTNSPLTDPNDDFSISGDLVFTNSDTPPNQLDMDPKSPN